MASVAAVNNLGATAHNPRGNLWVNDDTTFGHKLLMKMGWKKGKGLGKNEDGIKENLKVKLRSTNSGLGFKDDAYTNVMKNEYESILKNLKPQYSSQVTPNLTNETKKPLKSKVARQRLRYPKLFVGKDVTKYSEKDMKSIFICSQQIKETEEEEDCKVKSEKNKPENDVSKSGETIKSDLSVSEYFAMKMKQKKGSISNKSAAINSNEQTLSESSESKTENLTNNMSMSGKRKRKSLESSADEGYTNKSNLHSSFMQSKEIKNENLVEFSVENPSKKRKKDSESSSKLNGVNSYNGYEHKFSKKKNEKSQMTQNEYGVADITEMTNETCSDANLSVSSKKKKKKKACSCPPTVEHTLENPTFETELLVNYKTTNEVSFSKSIDNELLSENTNCLEKKSKRKKKLKQKLKSCLKSKKDSYSMKNVSFNENVSYRVIDSDVDFVEDLAEDHSEEKHKLLLDVNSTASISTTSVDKAISKESYSSTRDDINLVKKVICDKYDNATNNNTASTNEVITDNSILNSNSESCNDMQNVSDEESDELCILSPSFSKLPYCNSWAADQRQALKMNIYRKMLTSIEIHDVLKTTNLLSIKGYGNWGF